MTTTYSSCHSKKSELMLMRRATQLVLIYPCSCHKKRSSVEFPDASCRSHMDLVTHAIFSVIHGVFKNLEKGPSMLIADKFCP